MNKVLKRQRAVRDIVLRELMGRAERIRTEQRHSHDKLGALYAPGGGCISKGKARKPYEFGVKANARSFTRTPYDGPRWPSKWSRLPSRRRSPGQAPKQVTVDLGFRGVDAANPGLQEDREVVKGHDRGMPRAPRVFGTE